MYIYIHYRPPKTELDNFAKLHRLILGAVKKFIKNALLCGSSVMNIPFNEIYENVKQFELK